MSESREAFVASRMAAVEEVRRQAADVARTVSAESRQLQEEMTKLAVTLKADVSNRLEKLEARLLSLETRSEHLCSRQEMVELTATSKAGFGDRLEKLECRLLDFDSRSQHERSIEADAALREEFAKHKRGVEEALDGQRKLHDIFVASVLEQNKLFREQTEERFGKVCDGLRSNLETTLQEAHASLRTELSEHKKSSAHSLASIQRAHAALQVEFANQKNRTSLRQDIGVSGAEEEVSTCLSPRSFTSFDSADEEGSRRRSCGPAAEDACQPEELAALAPQLYQTPRNNTEEAVQPEVAVSPQTQWFQLDDDSHKEDSIQPADRKGPVLSGSPAADVPPLPFQAALLEAKEFASPDFRTKGASEELAAKLNKMNDRISKAQQPGEVESEVAIDADASPQIEVGCAVTLKRTGRQGVVIVKHDDDLPYKVRFGDGELPIEDWFPENAVELLTNAAEEAFETKKSETAEEEEAAGEDNE